MSWYWALVWQYSNMHRYIVYYKMVFAKRKRASLFLHTGHETVAVVAAILRGNGEDQL